MKRLSKKLEEEHATAATDRSANSEAIREVRSQVNKGGRQGEGWSCRKKDNRGAGAWGGEGGDTNVSHALAVRPSTMCPGAGGGGGEE